MSWGLQGQAGARRAWLGVGLVLVAVAAGCASSSTKVNPPVVNVSIGQQLIDLKKARDAGALTQREYDQQVRRLIDSVQ